MNFSTPKFESAVKEFKALCPGHEQLFRFGQFYVTRRTLADLIGQIEVELRSNIRFLHTPEEPPPAELNNLIKFFKTKLNKAVSEISVVEITSMLDLIEVGGDMAAIRAMFVPSPNDRVNAQKEFTEVWSTPDIGSAPTFTTSPASLGKALAASQLEKDRCFQVLRAFARKLLKKRGITNLPPAVTISDGMIAGAFVFPPDTVPATEVPQRTIKYGSPTALAAAMIRMKEALKKDAYVHCGVLSGALHEHSKFPQPEHHIIVFAHDTINGQDAFLFWDPDAAHTNIASTKWGEGFGVLFGTAGRLSTAFDDGDLVAIETNKNEGKTFGNHHNEKVRHCYQVYSLQTLPLSKTLRLHVKLLELPSRSTFDQMLHNTVALYAAHDIEIIEASREILTPLDGTDLGRFQTIFVGESRIGEPTADLTDLHDTLRSRGRDFGVEPAPSDVVVAFVRNLVPANRGCSNHPLEMPGVVVSASVAGEWTLAHEIGHLLGLEHVLDTNHLMFESTVSIANLPPALTDDDLATIIASPLTEV